jgi:hypothetical protein
VRAADRGLPIVNTVRSDDGLQVHGVAGVVEWVGAVTTGALANPRDDNGGRQVVGRAIVRPAPSIAVGVSAARGVYLDRVLEPWLPAGRRLEDGVQRAYGLDAEYSQGHWLTRAEIIRSRWTLPVALEGSDRTAVGATAMLLEGRYKLAPGWQVAGRLEALRFSRLAAVGGPRTWEAPVTRLELGTSYAILRNVVAKVAWQRNTREGGRVTRERIAAAQVVYWF